MKPPQRDRTDFEKVPVDVWISGTIAEVKYDPNHEFTYKGEKKTSSAVRFKFSLEGCTYPHYSRWMTFSYGEKANLYKKFLTWLVPGAEPDFDYDLDKLNGCQIKTMWSNNEEYQNLEMIRPLEIVKKNGAPAPKQSDDKDDEIPF